MPRTGRPKINEDTKIDILVNMEENPLSTSQSTAAENDVSQRSILHLLKKEKYHLHKIQLLQELNEDDPDRRMQFSTNIYYGFMQSQSTISASNTFLE
jgi:hypothetical protein